MYIYVVRNTLNNKIYIGQTSRPLEERFREHTYKGNILYKAIKKYGKDNFDIDIIEKCNNINELNQQEKYWIDFLNAKIPNGYNISDGGNGFQHTEKAKEKISKSQIKAIVGMSTITGDIKKYNSIKETEKDGFNSKIVSKAANWKGAWSNKKWVWIFEKEYKKNPSKLVKRKILGKHCKSNKFRELGKKYGN